MIFLANFSEYQTVPYDSRELKMSNVQIKKIEIFVTTTE